MSAVPSGAARAGQAGATPAALAPLPRWRTVLFGSGNFSVNLIAQTFATLAVFYYVDTRGANPALISLAMGIHGVFNAVLNPLLGHLSDRTRSRWGRRLPWIMFGVVPLAAAFTMIWIPLVSTPAGLFWYFLAAVLVYDTLFVVVVLNYASVFPEMFVTASERATGASWRQMFAIVGMILGVALGPVLYGAVGWAGMGITLGVATVIGFVLAVAGTAERQPAPGESISFRTAIGETFRNRAFVVYVCTSFLLQLCVALLQGGIPFFAKYALGNADGTVVSVLLATVFIAAIPMVYAWGAVIRRTGPKRALLAMLLVLAAGFAVLLFARRLEVAIAASVILGVAVAGMLVLLDIVLAQVIDIDAERTGLRREGMYMGVNGFIVRWSVTLQAIAMGTVLSVSGYHAGHAAQPGSVDIDIRLLVAGLPIAILVLAFAIFTRYPDRVNPAAPTPLP